jgi:hypothetical protein
MQSPPVQPDELTAGECHAVVVCDHYLVFCGRPDVDADGFCLDHRRPRLDVDLLAVLRASLVA